MLITVEEYTNNLEMEPGIAIDVSKDSTLNNIGECNKQLQKVGQSRNC
jgi:hypothetical protein